ncbi:DUF6261 family protein [Carboxylicivirga linearis]|uniref:Uncharacterized protein n=1 Tax=Carboxylicivirga linearis TaxID=1628157 RepID=A0ABS5JU13_9BACT|nr:DUF6261 family protein [Carboxylicivirga linearis]MBS2098403.1 hypothetical protein [Carboxylicivirga linearis]
MIVQIVYSYFSLSRLVDLANKITGLLNNKFPDNAMLTTVLSAIEANVKVALQSVGSTQKQNLTEAIKDADLLRDNCFISLKDHVRAGLRRNNTKYNSACQALWSVFIKNGTKLYDMSNDEQTAATKSLLTDLNTTDNQPHFKTIHAVEWLNELQMANDQFIELSKQRSAARSTDTTIPDDEAFKQLRQSVDLLENVLNTLYMMNDPEGIQEAVNEINQYITEANTSARQSK